MTTATATTSQPSFAQGGTASAFKARIISYCIDNGIELAPAKAQKLGVRIARRAEKMQQEFDFYESLRILGMTTDTTARQAEHRATCRKIECDTCGRKKETA